MRGGMGGCVESLEVRGGVEEVEEVGYTVPSISYYSAGCCAGLLSRPGTGGGGQYFLSRSTSGTNGLSGTVNAVTARGVDLPELGFGGGSGGIDIFRLLLLSGAELSP